MSKKILVSKTVYPSDKVTIEAIQTEKELEYPEPCHLYEIQNCLGFSDGETKYDDSYQKIQFVQKNEDGSITPGLQSEQLAIVMLHRLEQMNAKFPSPENELQISGLKMYLAGCELRVRNRIVRGVMGELKK